jgi:hypothetical protein
VYFSDLSNVTKGEDAHEASDSVGHAVTLANALAYTVSAGQYLVA